MTGETVKAACVVAAALLVMTGACGSGAASGNEATAAVPDGGNIAAADARAPSATPAPRDVAAATRVVAAGGPRCPATLVAGAALPAGARVIGTPPTAAAALSSATVTADAVADIGEDLSGLAEVEGEDGPAQPGLATLHQTAMPTANQPYTLVCRYGTAQQPRLAPAALLLPVPARDGAGGYRCTTRLPQGNDRRRVEAFCAPE